MTINVPTNAIGRIGMVAILKQVKPDDVGKLVVLRHPVGYISSLTTHRTPVFAWEVLMLGEVEHSRQAHCRNMMVADACLEPVSQMAEGTVEALAKAMAQQDLNGVMDELRLIPQQDEVTSEKFAATLAEVIPVMALQPALEIVP